MNHKILVPAIFAAAALVFAGCSTYPKRAENLRNACRAQDYKQAVEIANNERESASDGDRLQWELDYANCLRLNEDFSAAKIAFDQADETMRYWDSQADVLVSKEISAGLTNLSALPYRGHNVDRIMLQTYRALNFLQLGEIDAARPALNAAYREQTLAADRNAKEIAAAQESAKKNKLDEQAIAKQNGIDKKFDEQAKNEVQFAAYADYVNPFTTWLYGVYFLHNATDLGDRERSRKALERVAAMVPQNAVVRADLENFGGNAGGNANSPAGTLTYVIFEYGKIANLYEWRLDLLLPVPVLNTHASASIALPRMNCPRLDPKTSHAINYNLPIMTAGTPATGTLEAQQICDMNRVWIREFHDAFPTILTRTLTTAFAKTVATATINKSMQRQGVLVELATIAGTTAYNWGSAGADLRVWQTLPRAFAIARLENCVNAETGGNVEVSVAGRKQTVAVPAGKVCVIYVTAETFARPPRATAFVLKK